MTVLLRGKKTPIQRAIAFLRSLGQDAHVWLPGIGALNGIQTANYLDSAGTTLAAVNGPDGRVLDGMGVLGVELISDTGFDNPVYWTLIQPTAGVSSISGGALTLNSIDGTYTAAQLASIFEVGKTYQYEIVVTAVTGYVQVVGGGVIAPELASAGTHKGVITAISTAPLEIERARSGVATSATIDNISVREVTGIHAQQPTTSAKPILRRDAGGRYYWQFDGSNDSLSLGSVPWSATDDHCVIAGVRSDAGGVEKYVFGVSGASAANPLCPLLAWGSDNNLKAYWRNDAGSLVQAGHLSPALAVGTTYIASAVKRSDDKTFRLNGVLRSGQSTGAIGATTLTHARVGSLVNSTGADVGFLTGNIYPVIAIKGTVSDSDLLLLEKWVGSMSGVTIL